MGAPGGNVQPGAPPAVPEWAKSWAKPEQAAHIVGKKWTGPGDMYQSYQQLESFHGFPPERLLKLPEKEDAPEWGEVYTRLGRPEKPEGYELDKLPDGAVDLRPKLIPKAHELGLTKRQVRALDGHLTQAMQEMQQAQQQQMAQRNEIDDRKLRAEWGQAYDQNMELAQKAIIELKWDQQKVDGLYAVLGAEELHKLAARIGRTMGEHRFPAEGGGGPGPFGMTPDHAKREIAKMQADPDWNKAFWNPEHPGHEEAKRRRNELYALAEPGAPVQP